MGVAIGALLLIGLGSIPEGSFLAILVFVLLGAIVPTVAIPVGIVVIVYLVFAHDIGGRVIDWLGSLASAVQGSPTPIQPLAAASPPLDTSGGSHN